jgi:hypothetical protein
VGCNDKQFVKYKLTFQKNQLYQTFALVKDLTGHPTLYPRKLLSTRTLGIPCQQIYIRMNEHSLKWVQVTLITIITIITMVTINTIIMNAIMATISTGYQLPHFGGGGATVTLISQVYVSTKKFILPTAGN